jgi:D-alanyl-D-alanine carboxypeptidase/D-alanyl-D-alanine-endopeptidase (penicillin-binding protein 4)
MGVQIANCLQPSDNLRAENLMLMAAARRAPLGTAPYTVAQREMSRFLTETVGVEDGLMKPQDGSGLSRHNIVSAKGIIQLLRWADQQPTRQLWREALAGPDRPGTLRARLQGLEFAGKTGSLNMVSSLSGYLKTGTGKTYTVSLVLNHFNCTLAESRGLMDQFVKALVALP